MKVERTKREEYEICLERGHQSDATLTTDPPKFRCKWCGTIYAFVSELREENTPFADALIAERTSVPLR